METCPPLMLSFATDKFCSIDDSDFGFDVCLAFCPGLALGVAGVLFVAAVPDKGGVCPALEGGVAPVFLVGLAVPIVEKFHFPERSRNRLTCGCESVSSVTCSVFEKINGIISTPTLRACALMNGELLKAGSSAMAMLSAARLPDHSERLRLPTVTLRPRALVSSDSIRGRKLFTLTTNGRIRTTTTNIAITIPIILKVRFIGPPFRGLALDEMSTAGVG